MIGWRECCCLASYLSRVAALKLWFFEGEWLDCANFGVAFLEGESCVAIRVGDG